MGTTVAMLDAEGAEDTIEAPSRVAAARAALMRVRRQAADLATQAQTRTREQVGLRRTDAADRLARWAEMVRPHDEAEALAARRKRLMIAGGSSAALAGALCVGVALGYALSRQLRKRRMARQAVETLSATEANAGLAIRADRDAAESSLASGPMGLP